MSTRARRRWLAGLGLLALAVVAAWLLVVRVGTQDVATVIVTQGQLRQTIETTGVLEPVNPLIVDGQVSGRLQMLGVRDGERVTAGDILAQLDRAPFTAAVERATRARDTAEFALTQAEAAGVAQGQTARDAIVAAQRVADARAGLAAAEHELAATAILAPAAGTVLEVSVIEGQGYAAGAPIATLNVGDQLQVVADLDEVDVPHVPSGTDVTVVVEAFPAVELHGLVDRIAPQGTARGGGVIFPTTIEVDDFQGVAARPGMTVSVRIPAVVLGSALRVPAGAVATVGERSFVHVVRGGKTVRVEVTTGLRAGGLVEITSGDLRVGERVVADG